MRRRLLRHAFTICAAISLVLCVTALALFALNVARVHPVAELHHDGVWWRVGAVSGHVMIEKRIDPRDHQPLSLRSVSLVSVCAATMLLPLGWHLSRRRERRGHADAAAHRGAGALGKEI